MRSKGFIITFTYPTAGSVFKAGWEDCPVEWHQPSIAAEFGVIRSVRDITNKALDQARSDKVLRSSLEAQASLRTDSSDVSSVLTKHLCPNEASNEFALSDLLLVSHIGVEDYQVGGERVGYSAEDRLMLPKGGEGRVLAVVGRSTLCKCPRCWKYTSSSQDQLCDRCFKVVMCTQNSSM